MYSAQQLKIMIFLNLEFTLNGNQLFNVNLPIHRRTIQFKKEEEKEETF